MKKTVIITGASRGIGFELAGLFAKEGHRVICLSRNSEAIRNLKEENPNWEIESVQFDLSTDDYSAINNLNNLDAVHTLINNAGYLVNKPFTDITRSELEKVYATNVYGPFYLIQQIMPKLIKGKAHVLNITSMGGVVGTQKFPGLSAYSSSKGALSVLTECLASEYPDSGIIFNGLALGAVQTEMLNEAFPGYVAPISSYEMAEYIFNFEKNASKVINGKIIPVANSNP